MFFRLQEERSKISAVDFLDCNRHESSQKLSHEGYLCHEFELHFFLNTLSKSFDGRSELFENQIPVARWETAHYRKRHGQVQQDVHHPAAVRDQNVHFNCERRIKCGWYPMGSSMCFSLKWRLPIAEAVNADVLVNQRKKRSSHTESLRKSISRRLAISSFCLVLISLAKRRFEQFL